jgi:hypothetical protein
MTTFDPNPILELDGYLRPELGALEHRYNLYQKWKTDIEKHEGGYDAFSKGYLKFGLNVATDGTVIYREWAPNAEQASLIGDFSEQAFHTGCPWIFRVEVSRSPRQTIGTGMPIRCSRIHMEYGPSLFPQQKTVNALFRTTPRSR